MVFVALSSFCLESKTELIVPSPPTSDSFAAAPGPVPPSSPPAPATPLAAPASPSPPSVPVEPQHDVPYFRWGQFHPCSQCIHVFIFQNYLLYIYMCMFCRAAMANETERLTVLSELWESRFNDDSVPEDGECSVNENIFPQYFFLYLARGYCSQNMLWFPKSVLRATSSMHLCVLPTLTHLVQHVSNQLISWGVESDVLDERKPKIVHTVWS